jgi:hypothetical protein
MDNRTQQDQRESKQAYSPPLLNVMGPLSQLTAQNGGVGTTAPEDTQQTVG